MRVRSIKSKLLLAFSIMIFSISSLFIYILNSAFSYLQIYEEDHIKTSIVQHLTNLIKDSNIQYENTIRNFSDDNISQFNATIKPIWSSWYEVKNKVNTSQELSFEIEAIRYGMMAYLKSVKDSIDYRSDNQELFTEQYLRAKRIEVYITNYLDNLMNIRLEESAALLENQKKEVGRVKNISFITIAIISIVGIIFSTFFSTTITTPIIDLANNAKLMSEGNLNVKTVKTYQNDEVGTLTKSFNHMSRNIHDMVESLKDKAQIEKQHLEDQVKIINMSKSLKEAQFLSLQSQINPHFLFNTLNIISRTSMFEQAPGSVKLIESLSNIFRYNLNSQDKCVSLKDELDILKEYIFIQKTRYGERLNFNIECDINTSEVILPIFTLQPLVENAVIHGIEPKEEGGSINISIYKIDKKIRIEIVDTGIGFNYNPLKTNKHTESIGLVNVKNRLSLKFNNKELFEINSNINQGTTIIIEIPGENIV